VSRDREPTPLRASTSQVGAVVDVEALEQLQHEVERRARRWVVQLAGRLVTWLGLPIAGATGGYMAGRPEPAPVHREQPSSGPEPLPSHPPSECTPSERSEILEAQHRASRDARTAVDACNEMARKCDTPRTRDP
jgi:hypothetical protein